MNVHVFNPEHDIALAANSRFWTAPHAGRQLRADLGWLPALWASDGDVVVVDDVAHAQNAYRKHKRDVAGKPVFVTIADLAKMVGDDAVICPWGWDVNVVEQLVRNGISVTLLPTAELLYKQRQLSDRQTASRLLRFLCDKYERCTGEAIKLESMQEIDALFSKWGGVVLKAPWSSSGRGVKYLNGINSNNIIRWAEKVLNTQGHIMGEHFLDKILDFGMEFTITPEGDAEYNGLSLFRTINGAYVGNVLATENEKNEILSRYLPISLLGDIQEDICQWMKTEINGAYVGPFGVDMMICRNDDGSVMLDPCVEINLRRTMGHVALAISSVENDMQEVMQIRYEGGNYHFKIVTNHDVLF